MRGLRFVMLAAIALAGAQSAPAFAQGTPAASPKSEANVLCTFHGEGCEAPPADWTWQRLEPKIGAYTVELPCDTRQANAFAQLLAMGKAPFPVGNTRACMKATSGFTATLIGFTALPDDTKTPETEALLQGAPDLFSAFAEKTVKGSVPITSFKGRRAAINSIEKNGGRSRVAIIEVGKFALIMLIADIRPDFPGTPEEANAATNRFFDSLEIAE